MKTAEMSADRLSFEKIFCFPDYLNDLVKGHEVYPVHMQLGTVDYCNHDCTFCYAARSMFDAQNGKRQSIHVARLMEVIEEMCALGLRAVTIVGSGEPTLHLQIDEIIAGLARRGLDVGMFSNGSCVTEKTARAIIDHMTFVRFSMTGATPQVHNLVHRNNDFRKVVGNIERIVRLRERKLPTLGSQFILASYSAADVVEGARLAKSLGLDYYEIKPAYVAPDKDCQLDNTLSIAEARELMLQACSYSDDNFKVYAKVEQMEQVFTSVEDRPYHDCPGSKTNAVLEADLGLYLCGNRKTEDSQLGNLRDTSFADVWHGKRRREIVRRVDVHQCEPRCRMDPLNKIVHEIRIGQRIVPCDSPKPGPDMHPNFL